MILRLIVKKDGSFKTKDISFFWEEGHVGHGGEQGQRIYKTDTIPESEMQELLKVEIVGAELILESTDKWGE